jgi:hypothetical protein
VIRDVNNNNALYFAGASGTSQMIVLPVNIGLGASTLTSTNRVTIRGLGATSATTALRVENSNASASLVVLDNGAVGIGTTSPSSSILLDVSGSVRTMNIVPATNNTYVLGAVGNLWGNIYASNATLNAVYTGNVRSNLTGGVRISSNNANQWAQWFDNTGNLLLQDGGTFTDNNYRLQVYATGSTNSGSLFVGGTTVTTGSIARTMLISSSLSASANNDVLVGLDINPSFNTGSFTGITSTALRVAGNINPSTNGTIDIGSPSAAFNRVRAFSVISPNALGLYFSGGTLGLQIFATGNTVIQNGGTFTDAGYRLDVSGSVRFSDTLNFTNFSQLIPQGTTAADRRLLIRGGEGGAVGSTSLITLTTNNNITSTSGDPVLVTITRDFTPTSGTANYSLALISGVINQTGGANGNTRGLYINPTITSAASWRSIEWNNNAGWGLYGIGSASNVLLGSTSVGLTAAPSSRLHVRGSGATSATTAFRVENTNASASLTITDDLNSQFYGNVGIRRAATASLDVAGTTRISGSFNTAASGSILTVIGSGSAQPIFTVQGSQGELFSITDSLTGSLFSVNDISGLPILEVFSDNTTLIGNYQDPMLITTAKVVQTNSGSFTVYSLPTASYDTAFFEYSIKSGSNARAGTIMAIQLGSTVNFTETTTTDFGNTSAVSFTVIVTGSNMALTGSSTTGSWTTKCIVRGL